MNTVADHDGGHAENHRAGLARYAKGIGRSAPDRLGSCQLLNLYQTAMRSAAAAAAAAIIIIAALGGQGASAENGLQLM